jgi:5,10-methylenetetrahydromethanopterin reductase
VADSLARMEISCGFAPGARTVEYVKLAEQIGYERAWLFDSPALYGDIWMYLALAAAATDRIGLGTAVLVPNLRHPLVTASAIATLESLAPGRVAIAIGTGFTARMALGQRPLTWKYVHDYTAQVRALLRGEVVDIDGAAVQMIHPEGFAPARPIATPFVIGANGPKGIEVARELGDGVMTVIGGNAEFDWCSTLVFGTVLDDGEDASSERAMAAAGPGAAVVFHGMYEGAPEAVEGLPGGAQWRAAIEQVPEHVRHLAIHEGHFVYLTERDAPLLDGDLLRAFSWTGSAEELRGRLDAAAASGVTEVLYAPMGPDIERELRSFATMAGIA